jgi:hypothetical protein
MDQHETVLLKYDILKLTVSRSSLYTKIWHDIHIFAHIFKHYKCLNVYFIHVILFPEFCFL